MNLEEMIAHCREDSGDTSEPPRTSDDQWRRFADAVQNEAARRARLLVDSTTVAVCQIAVDAGTATYALDRRVLWPRRVMWAGRAQPLRPLDVRELDESRPGWEAIEGPEPEGYVRNNGTGTITLVPKPTVDGVVNMTVVRLPLVRLTELTDETTEGPELQEHTHEALVQGMLEKHFMKADPDVNDPDRAKTHRALFELEFGPPVSSLDEQWQMEQYGYTGTDEGYR